MKSIAVKQPSITQSEINKIKNYQKRIKTSGYSCWVTVRQSHTYGQGQILTSHKADNPVHLLSLGELNTFLKLEHDPATIRIFEQFPLSIFETMKIAKRLNIVHPGAYKDRVKHGGQIPAKTMTTDFVTLKRNDCGPNTLEPFSFKYRSTFDPEVKSQQSVSRTQAKLKIETEYWNERSCGLRLVDESFYCPIETYNFLYLRQCFDYPSYINSNTELYVSTLIAFKKTLIDFDHLTLKECIERISTEIGIEQFHVECIFKHATYTGMIPVDLSQKIELWLPLPFSVRENPYAY